MSVPQVVIFVDGRSPTTALIREAISGGPEDPDYSKSIVDISEDPKRAIELGVNKVPTAMLLDDLGPRSIKVGWKDKEDFKAWLEAAAKVGRQ